MTARINAPSLGSGIVAALVASVGGAAVLAALTPVIGAGTAVRAVVALLALAYVLYLLGCTRERVGRVTTVVLWLLAAAAAWLGGVPFVGYVLIHVGLLWLIRSLYFCSGLLPALADLGLCALGLAFAIWASGRSGSPLLALWCFFLVQAFHAWIPSAIATTERSADDDRAFERAHRAAEAAVRRLSATR